MTWEVKFILSIIICVPQLLFPVLLAGHCEHFLTDIIFITFLLDSFLMPAYPSTVDMLDRHAMFLISIVGVCQLLICLLASLLVSNFNLQNIQHTKVRHGALSVYNFTCIVKESVQKFLSMQYIDNQHVFYDFSNNSIPILPPLSWLHHHLHLSPTLL